MSENLENKEKDYSMLPFIRRENGLQPI